MKTMSGEIVSFNISPKGFYESFIMKEGKRLVQINFPQGSGPDAAGDLKVGQVLTVHAMPLDDKRPSDHPVYEWTRDENKTHAGIVKQINYARHGEPNGAILDTGEFVHMKPHGAKAVDLKVGQKLTVEGEVRTSPAGHTVIEATLVNGIEIDHPKPKKKNAA
jgi:hypothetical protein